MHSGAHFGHEIKGSDSWPSTTSASRSGVGHELHDQDERRATLVAGNGALDWLRALVLAQNVVQGHMLADNCVPRLLAPRAGTSVTVTPTKLALMLHDGRTPRLVIRRGAGDEITMTLTHAYDGHAASLDLVFWYSPEPPYALVHEKLDGRNARVKALYAALSTTEVVKGKTRKCTSSHVVDRDSITQFCKVVQNDAEQFVDRGQDRLAAPLDYAIVAGWQAVMQPLFSGLIDGDPLKLVHLSNSFKVLVPGSLVYAGDKIETRAKGSTPLIPRVHAAILQCSECHTLEHAIQTGHAALLDKWKKSGLTLHYDAEMLRGADLAALEWFRDSGLSVDCCVCETVSDRVRTALGIGCGSFDRFRELWIESNDRVKADATLLTAVDAIAAGTLTDLVLKYQPVTDVGIEALNMATASPTQALASLNLHGSTIDCRRLSALHFPPTLKSFNLSQSWLPHSLTERWLDDWAWPAQLEHLNLTGNGFDPTIAVSLFKTLPPGLKSLDLTFNQLGDAVMLEVVQNLPRTVTSLKLSNNRITGVGFQAICRHLPPSLVSLPMIGNKLASANARNMLRWSLPATVTELNFNGTALYTNGTRALVAALPPNLHTLSLTSANVSQKGAAQLFPALPPSLRSFTFSSNPDCETPATVKLLARSLPANLERLILPSAGIDEALAAYLFARLPRTLLHLDVSHSELGAIGLAALARHMPPNLESLRLEEAVVTAPGMRALAPAFPATLRELDLADNFRFTDAAALALAEHMPPALEKLVLRATRVSAVGVQAIRDAAPASLAEIRFPLDGDLEPYADAIEAMANGELVWDDE
ncbi:fatty acid synthase alpha subunit Lsd1 [Blastocladiella emersonii ATCC 22665]|nr:fatty acid synthase alpha subunit Lsd1 [Blastocladiella emersonii ATCC 22665]